MMFSSENTCWSCQREIELESIKTRVQEAKENEEVDTGSNEYIICPYCGEANDSCDLSLDHPEIMVDGDHIVTCQDCGEDFIVNSSVTYYYKTYKKDKSDE